MMEETRIESYSLRYILFFAILNKMNSISPQNLLINLGHLYVHLKSAITKSIEGNIPDKNKSLKQVLLKQCLRK